MSEADRVRGKELMCDHCGCTRWKCLTKFDGECCGECQHPPDVCWLNEDCIAGHHMDEIECRFPTWTDDANKPCPTCGRDPDPEPKHTARPPHPATMIGRK